MVVDKFGRSLESYKRSHAFAFGDGISHDFNNIRLANVGHPEEDTDAVTKSYLDNLLDSYTATDDVQSLRKELDNIKYFFDFENKRILRLNEPTASFHAATKLYVDSKDQTTKDQIRFECEKVKNEAIALGDIKRGAIRAELIRIANEHLKRIETIENNLIAVQKQQRIHNTAIDGLYLHLKVDRNIIEKIILDHDQQ